jgi:hypothetical protein
MDNQSYTFDEYRIGYVGNALIPVNEQLSGKANQSDLNTTNSTVALKSDKTYVDDALALKSDKTYVDNALALKVDKATTWTNLTLQNGTTVFGTRTPRYTKQGDEVITEGEIVATGAVTIATLPAGYRPPQTRSFKVSQNWSTSNDGATIYVNIDGTITIQVAASYSQTISLMGIRFFTT